MLGIVLGARDIRMSTNGIRDHAFLSQDILKKWLDDQLAKMSCHRGDPIVWGGNDLNDPFFSLETSHSHYPFSLPPYAHFYNPLESKAWFKGWHVIVHFEQWSQGRGGIRESEERRRERQYQDVASGYSLLWVTGIQSSGTFWGSSIMPSKTLSPRDEEGSLYPPVPPTLRRPTAKSCHMGCQLPCTSSFLHARVVSELLGRKQR